MSSSQAVRSSKYSYRATSTGPGVADINIEYSADLSALSRLEDKIRLLQDDLEVERELRQRLHKPNIFELLATIAIVLMRCGWLVYCTP
ncbi:paramyosin, long form-like [Teleopsis dalmanni]|uniref:paramyosin, long form-like n=1 Tax=Teleopsis dalmanni TaxID=139649 RepID=UPI0018CFD20A|nr:paramyosin, long form-like [Teleopsis dalmanni]